MKYLKKIAFISIVILMTLGYATSCTNDIGEDLQTEFQTFLEKNDSSEWVLSNEDLNVFIRINNDMTHLIEQWTYQNNLNCYDYRPNIFNPGNYTIKEHTLAKLVIDCDAILGDCDCMTFSRLGDILKVDIKISEWETQTVYFNKAQIRLDQLNKCVLEEENN